MKTVFIQTSPKKRFSNSSYLAHVTQFATRGKVVSIKYGGPKDFNKIFEQLKDCDNLVLTAPLYVDAVPSHVLILLQAVETFSKENNLKFNVYSLCNCGFYEGVQTEHFHQVIKLFANKSGLNFKGGLGVGAGEMIGVLRLNYVVAAIHCLINLIIGIVKVANGAGEEAFMKAFNPLSFMITILVAVLFTLGAYIHCMRLGMSISKAKEHRLKYTTVWFCPKFLFTFFASIYWFIRAFVLHGKGAFKLFNKYDKK